MVCLAPRAPEEIVRPRRLADVVVRPLNFTVRPPMIRVALSSASVVLALGVPGSPVHADERSTPQVVSCQSPRLAPAEALRIANAEAQRSRFQLSNFEAPTIVCSLKGGEDVWEVSYSGKSQMLDDCFSVQVNDRTRKAKLLICA